MEEIGNMTVYISFNMLLVLMAIWLLAAILLYGEINRKEDKINSKKTSVIRGRGRIAMALSPVIMTIISLLNIGFLLDDIDVELTCLIIAVILNVLFYIGAVLSFVMYLKLKRDGNKNFFRIKKYNYVLAFTTIVIFVDVIYTFILNR